MDEPEKLDLRSHDVAEDKKQELLRLFPEIQTASGKIDLERMKLALGETVDVGKERFGMNWPGKADCFKAIQSPSIGTLLPCPEESVNFDSTENLIIEGDNLEVLKLLQKSYLCMVKMIYIDPPYNTGNDFIYPDNYTESLQTYLEYTGQVDAQGKKFSTNTEADGRFHSKWLNMMYPRLYLARNLLQDDGVIFVSINDKEVHHLRALMNDVFGEENFIASLVWDKGHSAQAGVFKVYHEYVLVYARDIEQVDVPSSLDNDSFEAGAMKRESGRHPIQEFEFPAGVRFAAPEGTEFSGTWGGIETVELVSGRFVAEGGRNKYPVKLRAAFTQRNQMQQYFYGDKENLFDSRGQKIVEFYFNSSGKIKIVKQRGVFTPDTTLSEYGTQSNASTELAAIFNLNEAPLENPKPPKMLSDFAQWFTNKNGIILDFFAGSGTTAQADLEQNKEDGGNRKFILVQLPEPTGREDYPTIADICKERVRRAIKKLNEEDVGKLPLEGNQKQDRGFRVFKLAESNFKPWNANLPTGDVAMLKQQLELHIDHIREGRTPEDILYEILLKSGFPLTTPVERLTMEGKTVFSAAGRALLICLERNLTLDLIRAMAEQKPERVVCLDEGFDGNDQLKANAVQIFKTKGVTSFKTV